MDTRYESHSFADPLFYDTPVRWAAPEEFAATHEPVPDGWVRADRGIWSGLHPSGVPLPEQGWKVHVSARLDNAERVLAAVREHCLADRLPFKFLRGLPVLQLQNAKYAPRGASGKFCTLYPLDDAQLERCLDVLGERLAGEPGPYVLSDLRWQDGPLYLRYGAFVERWLVADDGTRQTAFTDPEGNLVPDVRAPVFEVPAWAPVPDVLRPALEQRRAARGGGGGAGGGLPYRVEKALHFSNAGGIYLAADPESGRRLVLKEARPHAGLDQRGTDAVTRLRHERAMLELLAEVPEVPELVGTFTAWEHEFLVQEYIEGETLNAWLAREYPLVHPDAGEREVAEYTRKALDLLERIERGLARIHARGVVFGDLHPHNLMVHTDGSVAFLDFELASPTNEFVRPALGAAGFAAPGLNGPDIDLHALAALRLWFFLPLQQLLVLDAGKAEELAEAVAHRFPVPPGHTAAIRQGLGLAPAVSAPGADPGADRAAAPRRTAATPARRARLKALLTSDEPDWPALRDSLAAGILASATPERTDRLFPGDVAQFDVDALSLSYGAAGVLYALHATGADVDPAHVDWLLAAERRRGPRPGLYTGSHGVALALDLVGRRTEGRELLDALLTGADGGTFGGHGAGPFGAPFAGQGTDLASGLPGTVLTLLHFARAGAEPGLLATAREAAEALAALVDKNPPAPGDPIGLLRGASGAALAFLRLHERTGDPALLDRAEQLLDRDLARCVTTADGTLQVPDGLRVLPYLEQGGTGIGLVLDQLLRHRPDSALATAQPAILRSAATEFVIQPNLFNGRAGLMAYLDRLRRGDHTGPIERTAIDELIDRHRRLLVWHLVPLDGEIAFPGEQLLRLSTDLATGSAGVLLALGTALADAPGLPFTAPDPAEGRPAPQG
ncbi:class III lanthionine synthetase LanKC [Kitasatospora sp. NPDC093806]|uniref:class III lanthionine synthetase LanKC n=1 Tax=Kitasatospora sp. NPDC093806 TaxID=3155075 RepID=UPI00342FC20D